MTGKKEGPGKDDVRAGDAAQPKKPYATIELKATEVDTRDARPAAASAAAASTAPSAGQAGPPSGAQSGSSSAGAASASATGAKPADTKPAAVAPKPGDVKAAAATASPSTSSSSSSSPSPSPSPVPPTAAAPRRPGGAGGFLSHMAAGVAGGFLALLGADAVTPHLRDLGLTIGGGSSATAVVDQRIAALERGLAKPAGPAPEIVQKLAAAEAKLAKLDDLAGRLAATASAQEKLAADSQALADKLARQTPADEAVSRVAKLEDRLAVMAAAAENNPAAGRVPQLAAITGKVADLETTLNNQLGAIRKSVAEQIESRVTVIAEGAEAAKSGTVRMDRDVSALKAESTRLGTRMEAMKADGDRLAETVRGVQAETGGVRSALDGFRADVDQKLKSLARPTDVSAAVSPVATKLSALEQNLQAVVKSEDDRKANAERIVLSLELANLKRVLDRGQKYAAELAEVKKASGGRIDLAALERHKDQGVATAADLTREFRPVVSAILDAESDPVDGGVVDRLWAGAKSVVRVRKVAHTPGDKSVEAVVARMEQALKDNRLADVVSEAKALPPKAQAPAEAWLAKVDARAAVDRALTAVESQLKSSLAGTSSK